MKRILVAWAFCLGLVGAAQANGTFYECTMNTKVPNGWVSPTIGFVLDGKGGVSVVDGIILHYLEKPLAGRVSGRGDRLRITWSLSGIKDSVGQYIPSMRYLANLDTGKGTIKVVAKFPNAPQRWSANGTCKIRKN